MGPWLGWLGPWGPWQAPGWRSAGSFERVVFWSFLILFKICGDLLVFPRDELASTGVTGDLRLAIRIPPLKKAI